MIRGEEITARQLAVPHRIDTEAQALDKGIGEHPRGLAVQRVALQDVGSFFTLLDGVGRNHHQRKLRICLLQLAQHVQLDTAGCTIHRPQADDEGLALILRLQLGKGLRTEVLNVVSVDTLRNRKTQSGAEQCVAP